MNIRCGVFPNCWKVSNVSPIPKDGDPHDPANYRPISLLPIISKVFERHIHLLLSQHVSLSENQWGFLHGRSTAGAVLSALYDWEKCIDSGYEILAIFFDLSKAFDTVPHSKLLDRLRFLNVPQLLVSLIGSYLLNRSQTVCVNGACSTTDHFISGVPQGSVLGPFLFLIYIDQIARLPLTAGTIAGYADDLCLYRQIKSQHDIESLQDDVNTLVMEVDGLTPKSAII
jgi:hypothetical protein